MSTLPDELGYMTRQRLALILDNESPVGRDWMGLADLMKFTYGASLELRRERSPTLALLMKWEKTAGLNANIPNLIGLLDSLGCKEAVDILKEEQAKLTARTSSCKKNNNKQTNAMEQIPSVSCKEHCSKTHKYDVFLSYAEEDEEFAEEMRSRLINDANLRVFIPSDELMPGKVFHREIADMIKQVCRKTVVILSPDYIKSPWCNYEANVAIFRSPDTSGHSLIPVLYRKCDIPAFLAPLYYSDYPRYKADKDECERYFWQKLYKSLKFLPPKP